MVKETWCGQRKETQIETTLGKTNNNSNENTKHNRKQTKVRLNDKREKEEINFFLFRNLFL